MNGRSTILGAGSYGSAIAQILTDNGYKVMLYTNIKEQAEEINNSKTNKFFFKNLKFNNKVKATTSIKEAINYSEYIFIALPSHAIREVLALINKEKFSPKIFVNMSKGLEPNTYKLISEIIEEEINEEKRKGIVVLSGPSHAEEIITRDITLLLSASLSDTLSKKIQHIISNHYMRVYTSDDLIGIQLAAAIKNILAIASGILYGMGYGDNTRAALITRGLAEMVRYARLKGAKTSTLFGIAGIGDLIVTATSFHSRNFQIGLKIGKGMRVEDALADSKMVVEGVRTAKAVYQDIAERNIEMPITEGVYRIFYENGDPKTIIQDIMKRSLKPEVI